ncbi:unnamed protein product [Cochlearia groenlandica]
MELNILSRALYFCHVLTVLSSLSTSSFISECPVSFEFMNYTVITSRCKAPIYPPKECCAAYKDFACPYSDDLNDLSNDCVATMFTYLNLRGNYPIGLFANQCQETQKGLECPALPPAATTSSDENAASTDASSRLWLIVSAVCLVFV